MIAFPEPPILSSLSSLVSLLSRDVMEAIGFVLVSILSSRRLCFSLFNKTSSRRSGNATKAYCAFLESYHL